MSLSPVGIPNQSLDPPKRMSFSFRDSTLRNTKAAKATDVFLMVKKNLRSMVTLRLISLKSFWDICSIFVYINWKEAELKHWVCKICVVLFLGGSIFGKMMGDWLDVLLDTRIFEIVVEHLSIHENCWLFPIVEYVGAFLLGGNPTKKPVFFWFPNLSHLIRIRDSAGSSWEVGPKQWGLLGFWNQRYKNNKFLGECHRHCWAVGNSPPKSTLKIQEFGNFW